MILTTEATGAATTRAADLDPPRLTETQRDALLDVLSGHANWPSHSVTAALAAKGLFTRVSRDQVSTNHRNLTPLGQRVVHATWTPPEDLPALGDEFHVMVLDAHQDVADVVPCAVAATYPVTVWRPRGGISREDPAWVMRMEPRRPTGCDGVIDVEAYVEMGHDPQGREHKVVFGPGGPCRHPDPRTLVRVFAREEEARKALDGHLARLAAAANMVRETR